MNPLAEIQYRIPFDEIRAEHVEPAIERLLEQAGERQRALGESAGPRTFENTLLALEAITETLDWAVGVVRHLKEVAASAELRAAYNSVQPKVSLFHTNILLDAGLWRVLKEYAQTEEAKSLTGVRQRFLKKTLEAFRRHGADLDEAGKNDLKQIDIELAQLTSKFNGNVLDATNQFQLVLTREEELAGLPESAREAARENARAKGVDGWRFTLHAPSFNAVMTYLDDRAIRKQVYVAYMRRATSGDLDNRGIIQRVIQLRQAKAQLLGYTNFADLVLEERMAKSGARAKQFLEQLRERTLSRFEEENRELRAFAGLPDLAPWDVAYYAEKLRARLYDFDEEALRPYYPLDQVVAGMFELAGRLYGIRVIEETEVPVWDAAVKYYTIVDEDGTRLGSFYADWFPRENKRGGAWMDAFLTGVPEGDSFKPHLGLICGNVTPPVGEKPSLLTHREVETVFHEFGHLLHHCLSRVEIRSLSGTNVPWDFVELPSQIMENWCWERESLELFARHYATGEAVPADLFEKMRRARTFRAANAQMRQLGFGALDLALHTEYSRDRDGDVVEYARGIMQPYSPVPLPDGYGMVAAFTHLFGDAVGYAAGYYSYKWAEVLDADAFTRFQQGGVFNRDVGREFREKILCRGDSDDPAELYRAFMGRDPDPSALLRRAGLA